MSGVSATGVGTSWPSKPRTHSHKLSPIPAHQISSPAKQNLKSPAKNHICKAAYCFSQIPISLSPSLITPNDPFQEISRISHSGMVEKLPPADLDPATVKVAIGLLGPLLSVFGFLFIVRIVMSWYPKLPVDKFPFVIAYAPTEPLLVQTRKLIPPLAGVDVTPVVWFGLLSFLNEILVGPQGLLVLLSQQL